MRSIFGVSLGLCLVTACATARVDEPKTAGKCSEPSPEPSSAPLTPATATVEEARAFYAGVDREMRKLLVSSTRAGWINQTYLTDDTDLVSSAADENLMTYLRGAIAESKRFAGLSLPPDLLRLQYLLKMSAGLPAPEDPKERAELASLPVFMTGEYGKGEYCPTGATLLHKKDAKGTKAGPKPAKGAAAKADPKDACFKLDDLEHVMTSSHDPAELKEAWTGWHAVGAKLHKPYARYVELGNKGAKDLGFSDLGALWRAGYDMEPDAFAAETERLWQQVKPFYEQLHCYARKKLHAKYGKEVPEKGPIPAHVLGNMWAQAWGNVYPLLEPYKGQPSLDVTKQIVARKLTSKEIVGMGESAFTSLGFDKLPATFWERSLFSRPADRSVVCHASAWDVTYNDDLRIKMCVQPTEEDLITVHHELGHVYYYHSYFKLPILLQTGANDGFHEGIGDTLALSVTPAYLKKLKLLDKEPSGEKGAINVLMKRALDKVAFLPFGLMIDRWRWDVFSGKLPESRWNAGWWEMRKALQGITPPTERTEVDFDPGAKFHVPGSTPYMRYFLAHIYQFQFHRALCKAAGHTGPLHECSIFGSAAAGDKLKSMLSLGASKAWPQALETLSGETKADAAALLEYFAPLEKWLKEETKGETCGW